MCQIVIIKLFTNNNEILVNSKQNDDTGEYF